MAITVTFRTPDSLLSVTAPGFGTPALSQSALKSTLQHLLQYAIDHEVPHVTPDDKEESAPATKINMSLPDAIARPLARLAKAAGISEGAMCRRLMVALSRQSAMMATMAETPCPPVIQKAIEAINRATPNSRLASRFAQNTFYLNIQNALSDGMIGLCEAGTGTGKTMAMLLAAAERLESSPTSRLVIAVPTIAVMKQFLREYNKLSAAGISLPKQRHVLGRRSFVSPEEVLFILDNSKQSYANAENIRDWVASGGPALPQQDGKIDIEHPWLAETLENISPDFPTSAAIIPDDAPDSDPGLMAYAAQFMEDETFIPEIIFATHAMLAVDVRRRMTASMADDEVNVEMNALSEQWKAAKDAAKKAPSAAKEIYSKLKEQTQAVAHLRVDVSRDAGKLPSWQYLMVDEAHMMEQAYSNALSEYVSLTAFERQCRDAARTFGVFSKNNLDAISRSLQIIREVGLETDQLWLNDSSAAQRKVSDALAEIVNAVSSLEKPKRKRKNGTDGESGKSNTEIDTMVAVTSRIRRQAKALNAAANAAAGVAALVKFSPVRLFPQIYVGRAQVSSFLEFTWATARAGAAVSATLYLPKGDGFSSWYQRKLLGIVDSRAKEYAPVASAWLYTQVEAVYTPPDNPIIVKGEKEPRLILRPPTQSDKHDWHPDEIATRQEAAEAIWIADLARTMGDIYKSAQGGVLVLMTSYKSAQQLRDALNPDLLPPEALITGSTDESLAAQKMRFLTISATRVRPIWIAVGGAWTGLDISGKDMMPRRAPQEDYTVTDLVIPRVPFGLNHSITHATRIKSNPSVSWEILDTLFRFKQGMGRLIRDEGLPKDSRRIWVLDNRINDPRKNLSRSFAGIRALLAGYKQKTIPGWN
jgi:CRISPR type IV-associated DEAD/DEAH-box helicase Csf4